MSFGSPEMSMITVHRHSGWDAGIQPPEPALAKAGEGQHWIPADAGMTKPDGGNIQIAGLPEFYMWRLMMQISARKQFLGRVTGLNIGPVNAEVSVDIGGGDQMTALSANDSIYGLALKEGDPASGRRIQSAQRHPGCGAVVAAR